MLRRRLSFARASRVLLALALFVALITTAAAFSNGQAATLVLGQPDFTSHASGQTASGMSDPFSVAIDPSSSKIFIADTNHNRVLRFTAAAALVNGAAEAVLGQPVLSSSGAAVTQSGMDNPISVAVDGTGILWVVDNFNNRVLRFDNAASKPTGAAADGVLGQPNFTSNFPSNTTSRLDDPTGVAVDSAGTLWVADLHNNRVLRFDNAASKPNGADADGVLGQPNFTTYINATTVSGMLGPRTVVVDNTGTLWVADTFNNRVLRFGNAASKPNGADADGVLGQPNFTSNGQSTTQSGMHFPFGVAVDNAGTLWVTDGLNNRVLRFDNAASKANGAAADGVLGQSDFNTSTPATSASAMNHPWGLTTDSAGNLWVTDSLNNRVLRFDKLVKPMITWANPAAIPYGTALDATQLNATANAPGSFSYTPVLGTMLNAGNGQTLSVLFTPTDTDNYTTATKTVLIDVSKASQTITFGALANTTYGDAPFTVSATASSSLAVSFGSTTPAICSMSGSTVTIVTGGTCTIAADQAGDTNYSAAPQVSQSFNVSKASQMITFGALADATYGDAPFSVSATASSNLAVRFGSTTPAVCTMSGSTVTIVAGGTCTITADQAGDTSYVAAPQVSQSFTVNKASQTITFGALADSTYGDAPFSVNATASSTLAVSFSSTTPAVCTISGSTVTIVAAGTCTIAADQTGDANYSAAPQVSQAFTVTPAPLTITANNQVKHVGTANPTLTASYAGFVNGDDESNLTPPVSLSTTATTGSAVGDYPISASDALNPNYTISYITGTLTVTNKQVPLITWAAPTAITYGTALSTAQLNATASVPGTFSYTPAAGTVLNAGNSQSLSLVFTPADTATYAAIPANVQINVHRASQTIAFGALANKTLGDAPFTVNATVSSGLIVTFSSTTPSVCTVSGSTVTLVAAGTCTISADQAGNANYSAAMSVTRSFTVQPADSVPQFWLYLPLIMR